MCLSIEVNYSISPDFFKELKILSFSEFRFSNADLVNCSFASNFADRIIFLFGNFFFDSGVIFKLFLTNYYKDEDFLLKYDFLQKFSS